MTEEGAVLPGAVTPAAFFGRVRELQGLRRDARALLRGRGRSRALCARAGQGKTELLLSWHGRLFREGQILPLYLAVPGAGEPALLAGELAEQIALQAYAYLRRDPGSLVRPPVRGALVAALRPAFNGAGEMLAEALSPAGGGATGRDLQGILELPHRFSLAAALPVLAMIDDAGNLAGGRCGCGLLARAASSTTAPLLLALEAESELRRLLGHSAAAIATLEQLLPLSGEAVRQMARHLARIAGLELAEAAVAALERESAGSPFYLAAVVRALGERGGSEPADVARAAATSACDGELARYWYDRLTAFLPVRSVRATAVEILAYCLRPGEERPETARLAARMLKSEAEVEAALEALARAGVVRVECARVAVDEDPVFRDAVLAVYRREFEGSTPAAVTASCAAAKVRGAAAAERRRSEARFREALASLLLAWDGQEVPRAVFDVRGLAKERGDAGDAAVTLPRVISVVSGRVGAAGSPAGCEVDALAWALRGDPGARDAAVAWVARRLAGGAGSAAQLAGYDRQVSALQAAGDLPAERLVRWALLDAPLDAEGEREASSLRVMTSTPAQLGALAEALGLPALPRPEPREAENAPSLELEMSIPRAADAELVAARALEQLAENIGMSPEDAGRLKTALVEACINAFEHSGDRQGRVRLWFGVAGGRLRIRVENRGRALAALPATPAAAGQPRRRGWGLTLMRQLVDDVWIEPREDGVSLVLEKELGVPPRG